MPSPLLELAWSAAISITLVGLGIFCLVREAVERRRNEAYVRLPPEDQRHFRGQFRRRVVGSMLFVSVGIAIFVGQGVLDWKESRRLYLWLWIGVLLGLFGTICLAGADLLSIRRYARRQQKRLERDRREMIERQLELFRAERADRHRLPPDFDVERN